MDRKYFIDQSAQAIKRAYQFLMKSRKQNIVELGDDIDAFAIKRNDVFEFGIRLAVDGVDSEQINIILDNIIAREKDSLSRRLKTIQKEAVKHIQDGSNSLILLNILFSYLSDDEKNDVKGLLADDAFKTYFELY